MRVFWYVNADQTRKGRLYMLAENSRPLHSSLTTRFLIACGAIGPLLFIVVFLIEGATRPGYSAWRNQVSQLSLSDQGWMQIANFLVCGVLTLCFAIGLQRVLRTGKGAVWVPRLLGIFSVALIIVGIFITDPGLGYPPGSPANGLQSLHGAIHGVVGGFIVSPMLAAAIFVMVRRFAGDPAWRGWALYSLVSGIVLLVFFLGAVIVAGLDQNGILPASPAGLLQRIGIITGWGWIALLALRLWSQMRSSASTGKVGVVANEEFAKEEKKE